MSSTQAKLKMILSLFKKKPDASNVHAIYADIVTQARQKVFYADWAVPDTVTGRFDMISLHLCLVFRRLKTSRADDREFSQALFDLFFKDMDHSLRELGAGDMAVPKRIQKMGELLFGLLASITETLDKKDQAALQDALSRNIYSGEKIPEVENLAHYVMQMDRDLKTQDVEAILSGNLVMKAAQ